MTAVMTPVPAMLKHCVGFVSWGMQDSDHGFNSYSNDPAAYVAETHADGIDWHCMQVVDRNMDGGIALMQEARGAGRHFGGWTNAPQECVDLDSLHHMFDLMAQMKVGFMRWNIEERWGLGGTDVNDPETRNNCHKVLVSEFRKRFPKMPATVQTNFGGFDKLGGGYDQSAAAIYNAAHIFLEHEDYWVNNENLTPSEGDFAGHDGYQGTGCKFNRPSVSTTGIFASETGRTNPDGSRLVNTCAMEIPRLQASGRHHFEAIWTMEYMTDDDRAHVGLTF